MKSYHQSGDISGSLSPYYSPGIRKQERKRCQEKGKMEKTIKLCDTTCLRAVDSDVRDWEVCVYVGV